MCIAMKKRAVLLQEIRKASLGTQYRDQENDRELMGGKQPLGKAFGIVAICIFGLNLPTEEQMHADRLRVWRSAARYCLTDKNIDVLMQWQKRDPETVVVYMLWLLTAALVSVRTELPNSAWSFGQNFVFAAGRRDPETQRHLGLDMSQSVMDL